MKLFFVIWMACVKSPSPAVIRAPKPLVMNGEEVADVCYWQSVVSGSRVTSVNHLDLFDKRDFERFEKWLAKAKAWTLDRKKP